jgi:hypothetical protein
MSAKNYKTCPQCEAIKATREASESCAVASMYGRGPEIEYLSARQALSNLKKRELPESLAEYYEHSFSTDSFTVTYSCSCDRCGFSYTHRSSGPVRFDIDALDLRSREGVNMPTVLVHVTEKHAISFQKLHAGLVTIAYDKDHEIVWFEAVDPLEVSNTCPSRQKPTEADEVESFYEEMADLSASLGNLSDFPPETMTALWDSRKNHQQRIEKMSSPAVQAVLEGTYKAKLAKQLAEKYELERQLLTPGS